MSEYFITFIVCIISRALFSWIFQKYELKFFLFWLCVCVAYYIFWGPAWIIPVMVYIFVTGFGAKDYSQESTKSSNNKSYSPSPSTTRNTSRHSGSSYHPGGDVDYLPNGNSAVRYGNVTNMSNSIYSVKQGTVTYFFDDNTGKRLGHSVDNGNGVFNYFDDDGREIGHSYRSGDITDYFGDCFETR